MKNLVPPKAQRRPKVTAICIQTFFLFGNLLARNPDNNIGAPNIEGKNEVIELDCDRYDINSPQRTRKKPYSMVKFTTVKPNT